jgi:hypothetical protein
MSGVQVEAQEAGCRIPGGQVGGEFITLSNQKRFPTPLFRPLAWREASLPSSFLPPANR